MSEVSLNLAKIGFEPATDDTDQTLVKIKSPVALSEIIFLGITLACLQVLDGVLTAVGVLQLGFGVEANFLVRNLMQYLGVFPALIAVKTIAIAIVATLCHMATSVSWVNSALKGIIVIYLCVAIVPWVALITFRLH